MIKFEHSLVIDQPLDEVFAFLNNEQNDPIWQAGVLEAKQTSEGAVGVGTTVREVRKFLGRRIESTYEITEYELNKKVSSKATSGPIPFSLTTTFEPAGEGTKLTIKGEAEPGGFFKLAGSVVSRTFENSIKADFDSLKVILEAGAYEGA